MSRNARSISRVSLKPLFSKRIATANPPYRRSQQELAAFMARIEGLPAGLGGTHRPPPFAIGHRAPLQLPGGFWPGERRIIQLFSKQLAALALRAPRSGNGLYSRLAPASGRNGGPLDASWRRRAAAAEQNHAPDCGELHRILRSRLDIQLIQRLGIPPSAERSLIGSWAAMRPSTA